MKNRILIIVKVIIGLAVFAWFGFFLAHKIDLSTADLGRHIANGSIIIHGSWHDKWAVLNTNFYSYTLPNQPFVNHHWLSGVIFYLIYIIFGFVGLSVFYVVLGMLTLLLFFDVARKASNFWIATASTIIVIPLITSRAEVRPEMFTYFFTGVFFWLLWHWRIGMLAHNRLLMFPAVMLLWVNLHIGFVFGFLVLGAFGLEQLIKFWQKKPNGFIQLLFISGLCIAVGLINPFGYKILIYPFLIFKNYAYLIVENQSVSFLENLNRTGGMHFLLLKMVVGSLIVLFAASAIKSWKKLDIAMLVLTFVTAVMAYLGIRNFPSFAFFALPALAVNFYALRPSFKLHPAYISAISLFCAVVAGFCLSNQYQDFNSVKPVLGLGLLPQVTASADFYKAQKIDGPVFNNYDVGSYLIFETRILRGSSGTAADISTDHQVVFVDNRPEAYTNDFFQNIYVPAQENEQKWHELDSKYKFNSIFFAWHDLTPWAQTFLISRVNDKNWVPVFADSYNIIFVRLNRKNLDLIGKYEIPRDRFSVYKP